ncbi:MAG TPA: type II toxin-antitoxin system prevent-host-death family antitoxin [Thermodesulfobacteriota bacterium]|jgi:prevent-host-death family protein
MQKAVNALKVRKNLGEILEEVYYKGNHFVIKRGEKPMAVLISMSEYEAYLKQRDEDFGVFNEIRKRNKNKRPEEIEKDIAESIRELRKG